MSKRYFIKGRLTAASQMYDEIKYSTILIQKVVSIELSEKHSDFIPELIKHLLGDISNKYLGRVADVMKPTNNGKWIVGESSIDITLFQPL